jgi:hypothetical protein
MQELNGEWLIGSKPSQFDDIHDFELWMDDGSIRLARRVGNRSDSLTPGTMAFTDCRHPLQNVICDESRIQAWRVRG